MAISIDKKNGQFFLRTKNTMYVIGLFDGKYPVNLYYGRKARSPHLSARLAVDPLDYFDASALASLSVDESYEG